MLHDSRHFGLQPQVILLRVYLGAVNISRAKIALIPVAPAGGQLEALSRNLVGRLCKLAVLDCSAKKIMFKAID